MKFQVYRNMFALNLSKVGRAIGHRGQGQVFQSVLLEAEDGVVSLTCTDTEIAIKSEMAATVEESGEVVVPWRIFSDIVANTDGVEKLEFVMEDGTLKFGYPENAVTQIHSVPTSGFPSVPFNGEGEEWMIPSGYLEQGIARTVYASNKDIDQRKSLYGVHMEEVDGKLKFVGADGYRLALQTFDFDPGDHEETLKVTIPFKAAQEVLHLLKGADGDNLQRVTINHGGKWMSFKMEDTTLLAVLHGAEFPAYMQLIPNEWKSRIIMDATDLSECVRSASVYAMESSQIMKMYLSGEDVEEDKVDGQVEFSATADELGVHRRYVDAVIEGDPDNKIAFNCKYTSEMLSAIYERNTKMEVALNLTSASNPGVWNIVNDPSFTYVLMPMFIQWADRK